jgi:YebC/PmpR family DNA-binding regulatory protein
MSGHSHWSSIKHKKGAIDAKRGKLFSKLSKLIITAAHHGGGDPDSNLRLRYAIDDARAANMTKDTIERAIKKGTGELEGMTYEELTYEGYAPGGVALMIEILTDSRNRTASEIRKVMENRGGSLGAANCVAWMFHRKGLFTIDASKVSEDKLMEVALDAGADDVKSEGKTIEVTCDPVDFEKVKKALTDAGITPEMAKTQRVPSQTVKVDRSHAKRVLDLISELEEHEDVQNVYSNFDIDEQIMQELIAAEQA